MGKRRFRSNPVRAAFFVGIVLLGWPATAPAQSDPFHPNGVITLGESPRGPEPSDATIKPLVEPYGGQIYCPVTGTKLGLSQEPTAVQTAIGAEKPSTMGRFFGQKEKPGVVIYVSAPEYAEEVRKNPMPYFTRVIMDKSTFGFTYARAPAQRPAKAPVLKDGQVQEPDTEATTAKGPAPSSSAVR